MQRANNRVLEHIRRIYEPKLGWLKNLRSLVIIPHPQGDPIGNAPGDYNPERSFIMEFLDLLFSSEDLYPHSLERLWIPAEYSSSRLLTIDHLPAPCVKSLSLWEEDDVHTELHNPKFNYMEHLGDVDFSDSLEHMKNLEYVDGLCVNDEVIDYFIIM